MFELVEPIGVIPYSADDANDAMFALGFTNYWDTYFAGRAAPLGSSVPAEVVHALFYFWAAGSLMVYMLSDSKVTTDELYAVGATFTLVAWAFAYVFVVLQILQPGCFTAAIDPAGTRTWMELLFLSFTNLSSTGLSDVVPVTAHARSVVMIEQLAGLGYVALFVSRLVGLTIGRGMVHSGDE